MIPHDEVNDGMTDAADSSAVDVQTEHATPLITHEAFFRGLLADIDEATAPFGLLDISADDRASGEARQQIPPLLDQRLRAQAQRLGVSVASLCHLAWAQVVARSSGFHRRVLFGTVLPASVHAGEGQNPAVKPFTRSMPMRVDLEGFDVTACVRQVHHRLAELNQHAQLPLDAIQRCSCVEAPAALFTAQLHYWQHDAASPIGDSPDALQPASYPFTMSVADSGHALELAARSQAPIEPARICAYMAQAFGSLADALEYTPGLPVQQLEILPAGERALLLETWNDTAAPYPHDRCVHQLFETQAEQAPDAVAVAHQDHSVSYGELNARANRLAHRLIAAGVLPDTRVAICVARGPVMLVGMLAILKAGGAYVPLDPAYPGERLVRILDDADPLLVLADTTGHAALAEALDQRVVLDPNESFEQPASNPQVIGLNPRHLAYIIYTSGSTGIPKGVMVEHRGWSNLVRAQSARFEVRPSSRILQFASLGFDVSAWEIGTALACGATLDLPPNAVRQDVHGLWNYLEQRGITHAALPPALFQNETTFARCRDSRLVALILTGEACSAALLRALGAHVPVFNAYGPTEITVWATAWRYPAESQEREAPVSIGRPLANTRAYLLDEQRQPVPLCAIGELYIGGAGVARGYLNRAELSAERFLADPFARAAGDAEARMYRTGDLARYLPDGNLVFLGRNDQQIKLRGFRIEPGEIEARLLQHPSVRECAVIAREDQPGLKQLVGYVVLHAQAGLEQQPAQETQRISEWQDVYEHFYEESADFALGENFSGWNSSYSGQPLPVDEMQAWRAAAVARILALRPRRLLEIGVGSGLLLARLIGHCESYWATDFSATAIEQLRAHLAAHAERDKVHLRTQAAHQVDGLPTAYFDTIVINSVIQHFPHAGYLVEVIRKAMALLAPGGALFLGDIRNLQLLQSFTNAVQLQQPTATADVEDLRRRVQQSMLDEKQLLLAPEFFAALPALMADLGAVDIRLKRGSVLNELTRYRYEVVLRKGPIAALSLATAAARPWADFASLDALQLHLARMRPAQQRISGIPNARLGDELAASRALQAGATLAVVRDCLQMPATGIDPEALHTMGEALGYTVITTWCAADDACLDAIFIDPARLAADTALTDLYLPATRSKDPTVHANSPGGFDRVADLRRHVAQALPSYMVPAAIVQLDALPLTPNRKLDRKALPAPEFAGAAYRAPRNDQEAQLCELFAEVLGLARVGIDDSFFELGGHSLLAVRLLNRIQQSFAVELPLGLLFAQPRLGDLAAAIAEAQQEAAPARPPILPGAHEGGLPLSFAQQRLWFLAQLDVANTNYHVPLSLRLDGVLDRPALRRALDTVFARHDGLRTIFVAAHGEPQAVLLPAGGVAWDEHDLRDRPSGEQDARLDAAMQAPFDLAIGPLLRVHLWRTGEQRHLLLLMLHHIVCDGWSLNVLLDELGTLYAAYRAGRPNPLAPLPIQYPDYAAWQRNWFSSERLHAQAEYWRRQLADAPVLLELPTDRSRPPQQSFAGGTLAVELDAALTEQLRQLAQRHGATLFIVMMAAWASVLSRLSGQRDLVIGTPTAGRGQQETEPLIGFFVNTLAMRVDLAGDPSVADLLAQVRASALAAQDHQDLPFEQVVEIVQPPRRLAHTPLFQTMLAWQADTPTRQWAGLQASYAIPASQTARFDLELIVGPQDERIAGTLCYATALFDAATIQRYRGYLLATLAAMAADATQAATRLPMLGAAERSLLLEHWNDTAAAYPGDRCIQQLVEAQVRETPDATALIHAGRSLSYAELNTRANRLAHALIDAGSRPERRIVLCVERGVDLLVGLLGIMKSGAAYVPLDPAYPGSRLLQMLGDAAPSLVLVDAIGRVALGDDALAEHAVMALDAFDATAWPATDPLLPSLRADHPAYLIYTSGSTGTPKGVMVEHRQLVASTWARAALYRIDTQSRLLPLASMAFDSSIGAMFGMFVRGGCLLLPSREAAQDPAAIAALVREHRVSGLLGMPSLVPLLLAELGPGTDTSLRQWIVGGETCPASVAEAVAAWSPDVALYNEYGPTEATVWATVHRCRAGENQPVPIGRPIANARAYVLDDALQPVPLGATGELYIGGAGVARGYWQRAQLTAGRFLPDPFAKQAGARMYRTGDLARQLADGELVFLGRNDQQVKLRGFRIEPGEIEACLREHPAVREAAVVVLGETDPQLVAYATGQMISAATLREHLADRLPDYMIPGAFVHLEHLPLTPNGKLDRKALPAPGADALAHAAYVPPSGPIETTLAALWQELLGVERVGRHDRFFELGGHSLIAVRLLSRLNQAFGVELRLVELFAHSSLQALATVIAAQRRAGEQSRPPIQPISRDDALPLSFAQQRLWFLAQLDGGHSSYHIALVLHLRGKLDVVALRRSLDALYARHESLRSVFVSVDGQPRVALLPAASGWPWQADDLRGADEQAARQTSIIAAESRAPFDLRQGPLVRARLLRLADDEYRLVLTQHHIVSDGWSFGLLCDELSALYAAFREDRPDPLPPLSIQYPDYAAWQREWLSGERLRRQADYWRRQLGDAPALLSLPTDRARPSRQSFEGAFLPVELDAELTEGLKRLGQQHGSTLFITVMAAWAAVLARLSGQDDLVIGTPSANRGHHQVEALIGFFVNTLAMRVDLSGEPSVADLLARVRTTALAAQDHQDLPFEQVVEIVQPPRRLDHTPLFQVLFAWQNNEQGRLDLPGVAAQVLEPPVDAVRFDLELHLYEQDGGIGGGLVYATALFDAATIERQRGYLLAMLRAMAADANQAVSAIDVLSIEERAHLLAGGAESAPVSEACIHQRFEAQARRTPQAVALCHAGQQLSYGELDARANRLAHRLLDLGLRPDEHVAICVDRGFEMVVGLLGILKAGGAYIPLDPAYPAPRLVQMLDDARPALVLVDAAGRAALDARILARQPVLDLDANDDENLPATDSPAASPGLRPSHLAYVIYTSGSTGTPKGVAMPHRPLVNLVDWHGRQGPALRTLQFASLSFDVAFQEIFSTLCSGAALVLIAAQERLDMPRLLAIIAGQRVQRLFLPYIAAQALAEAIDALDEAALAALHDLREVIVAGEQLRITAQLQRMFRRLPDCRLHNHYGPTETHLASAYVLAADLATEPSHVPIGRPISHVRLYLLDRHGRPVPQGAVGELYIGGAGVARGYLHRAELTAERFVPDPFAANSDGAAARMYKTGDLARRLPDGNLVFLGRNDQQVKLRGFRIEPGEIETRLDEHPLVRECAVIAREDRPGQLQLVAYVVPNGQAPTDLAGALRTHLASRLPDYMVPAAFVALERLPLTPNGKLDRKALPAPEGEAFARQAYAPPQGDAETDLAALWQSLLGVERVGRHDHFFELGGHSLLAVRLLSRINQAFRVDLPLTALFASPRLDELAAAIESQQQAGEQVRPPIAPLSRDAALPLSFAQQRLWFLAQLDGAHASYHIPLALRLRGELDVAALRRSLDALYARHDSLRSIFHSEAGQPQVRLLPAAGMPYSEHDLRGVADPVAAQRTLMSANAAAPFDLQRGPLIRTQLLRLHEREYLLLLTQHHIVSDGWSIELLLRELGQLYVAFESGRPDPLPPLSIQYPDYAAWQREWLSGERLRHQADYWRRQLGDAPALLSLPTDRARPSRQSFEGAFLPLELDAELTEGLKRLGQQHGTTLFITVMTAWAAVLARLSGQDDLVIGTPSANRGHHQVEALIGFFVNTLAMRVDLSGELSVADLLARVRTTALAAQDHQDLPFEQVVEIVQPPRRLDHTPLFQVMFTWLGSTADALVLPGISVAAVDVPLDLVKYDLNLALQEGDGVLRGGFSYATALFDAATIERQRGYLLAMLRAMVEDASQPVTRIAIIDAEERQQLLHEWNRTEAPYPREQCLHQLFEAQVQRTPQAVAVVDAQCSLDYAGLNAQANRLAHQLRSLGVGPDRRVAICVERSVAMLVGLLGILKAGGAYVPLDPIYTGERLARILVDAGPAAVLVDAAGHQALGADVLQGRHVLDLDDADAPWHRQAEVDPQVPGLTPQHLAYVIYTSGSTGLPKGVMVEHHSVVNFWHALTQSTHRRCAPGSRVALNASFAFDMSVKGWSQLLSGHSVHLIPQEVRASGAAMLHFLEAHAIDAFDVTPSQLEALIEAGLLQATAQRPRSVLLGGEPVSPALLRKLQACRSIEFHNMYGPTECTVDATAGLIGADDALPSIGRAMPNARIYLLDRHGEPVPCGAIGEIHIGGEGVARGYLDQPQLTGERFLRDPFDPRSGARMYRTGDLARYLADGRLVFMGRNDHQVKIRGFRIELGEIETRLLEHPAVHECAVIARADEPNEQRLVAYVVSRDSMAIDGLPATLRAHLAASLPDYMLPAAFVAMAALPLTANGKLNRHALPAPGDGDLARGTHAEPEGATEIALALLWRDMLGIDRVGRHDHFFELGGHSLLAVQLATRMQEQFGIALAVREVFAQPVLKELAARLSSTATPGTAALSLEHEAVLDPTIRAHGDFVPMLPPRAVLLTGIPGFLGLFLLCSLLRRSEAIVHCLMRADSIKAGRRRLEENLARLGLLDDYAAQRVVIVPGDLGKPLLGLAPATFEALAGSIDAVYHNGAWVNFLHNYQTLKATNVSGTQEIMRLAGIGRPLPIHYVSTMSVAPLGDIADGQDGQDGQDDQKLHTQWQDLSSGYVQSKWVAERILRIGAGRGLPVAVYRPTHLSGSSRDGAGNASDSWNLFVDACLELGEVPLGDMPINMIPVDDMSDYIVELSLRAGAIGRSYNLFHPRTSSMQALVDSMLAELPSLVRVPYGEWLAHCHADLATRNLATIMPTELPDDSGNQHVDMPDNAVDMLIDDGHACPAIDASLLRKYVHWRLAARTQSQAH